MDIRDNVRFEEFRIGDLFDITSGDVDLQQKDINGKGCRFINSGLTDYGIKGMTDRSARIFPANTLTFDFWGNVFYRDFEYKLATHNHVFSLSGDIIKDKSVGLYLAAAMTPFRKIFSYDNMATQIKIRNLDVQLPIAVDNIGNPIIDNEKKFHPNGYVPDYDYMRQVIEMCERDYIDSLERERLETLDRYLAETGLDDYALTGQELKMLYGEEKATAEFDIGVLFSLQKTKRVLSKLNLEDSGYYPVYSSDTRNNGIIGYTYSYDFECNENNPVYVVFGDHTCTMNICRECFSVMDNVKILLPCVNNDNVLLYLFTEWRKKIPNLGYARHWSVAKNCKLNLPIQTFTSGESVIDADKAFHPNGYVPDWDYMARYIRAVEKLTIKDVVEWKDRELELTRRAVQA